MNTERYSELIQVISFLIGIILTCFLFLCTGTKSDKIQVQRGNIYDIEDSVRYYIDLYHLKFPHIVYAQFKLESGNGTSKLCKEDNNLFGMRSPKQRLTTSIHCSKDKYAVFSSIETAVIDYLIFQRTYIQANTEEEYLVYLSKYYAQDTNYISKIIKILN
jgi:flagellum-specific peptidoglycan hydrolase FlgJ